MIDFLTRVQLTAVELLEASDWFTPPAGEGVPVPIISEVKGDIEAAVKQRQQAGLIVVVALSSAPLDDRGGSGLTVSQGRLIVRAREIVTANRGSYSAGESALAAAQQAALALHNRPILAEAGGSRIVGLFAAISIEQALPDDVPNAAAMRAFHATFRFSGGIYDFPRGMPAGSP